MEEKQFFDAVYINEALHTISHTQLLIVRYNSINDCGIKSSLLELISVYYGKLFLGSKKAYKCSKKYKHRLDIDQVDLNSSELLMHHKMRYWRDKVVAHLDQDELNITKGFALDSASNEKVNDGLIYSTSPSEYGLVTLDKNWDFKALDSLLLKWFLFLSSRVASAIAANKS